jgi:hypothetical protein
MRASSSRRIARFVGIPAKWRLMTRLLGLGPVRRLAARGLFVAFRASQLHYGGGAKRAQDRLQPARRAILAGHKSIQVTQVYIDGDTRGQRRLVTSL